MIWDAEKYMHHLDDAKDLTREQKVECIECIIAIMENFTDRAFNIHPVQLARGYRDKNNLQSQNSKLKSKDIYFSNDFDGVASSHDKPPHGDDSEQ